MRTVYFRQNVDFILEIVKESRAETLPLDDLNGESLRCISFEMTPADRSKLTLSEDIFFKHVVTDTLHFSLYTSI
jgi:hypothetical protein